MSETAPPAYILVVDDNSDNLYVLTHILERRGYAVRTEMDGSAAVAAVLRERPALLLLDIRLPGLSGYQVVEHLRGLPELAGLPVIAVTAHAMPGDRDAALAAGCDDYLTKPIVPRDLLALVRRYLPPTEQKGS